MLFQTSRRHGRELAGDLLQAAGLRLVLPKEEGDPLTNAIGD
jgi:hypothetical protein